MEDFNLKNISSNSGEKLEAVKPKSGFKAGEILFPAFVILVIIFAGVGTGYLLSNGKSQKKLSSSITGGRSLPGGAETVATEDEVGIKDETVFSDTAQGRIEVNDGEIVSEGSHKLIRPGGQSQTAYLTSSVLDLNDFEGECVQIWGETFQGQQAGWLMDVGRVKKLDDCPDGV